MRTCLFVLLATLLAGCEKAESEGRFRMTAFQGNTENDDRVWLLDTLTGRVSLCSKNTQGIGCLDSNRALGTTDRK